MSLEFDGAEYLRKLKQGETGNSASAAPITATLVPERSASVSERRKSLRYPCHGSVKFSQEGSEVHSWGAFTDVSLHGCYIEVTATFPLGSRLLLSLELGGLRAEMNGEVRISYPFLGMGIAFREMSEENRRRLAEMVRSLAFGIRPKLPPSGETGAASSARPTAPEPPSDPRRALEAIVDFFEKRELLTREEFYRLLRDSQTAR